MAVAQHPSGLCEIPRLDPDVYAKWRASEIGRVTERLEWRALLEAIGEVDGKQILDVGCGDGAFAVELCRRGADVVGIDSSATMIEAARARAAVAGADLELCRGTAERLPFATGCFDVVVATTVLCFVDDAAPTFREIGRVLRPEGRLVIGELGRWSTWAMARRIRAWLGSTLWRRGRFRTPRELRRLAERAGLAPDEVRGAVFYPRLAVAARWMAPIDALLGRFTTLGAAFITLRATKSA